MSAGAGGDDTPGDPVLRRFHDLLVNTQNPVYAWLAIEYLFQGNDGMSRDWPIDKEFRMPGWIAAYLQQAAGQLSMLSAGVDYRIEVAPPDFEHCSTPAEAMNSPEFRQSVEAARIEPVEAMKAVPAALGLTRTGWNAFASFLATTDKMQQFRAYEAMKANGIAGKVAIAAIGEGIGVTDPAHIHGRIREGRQLADDGQVGNPPHVDSPSGNCPP